MMRFILLLILLPLLIAADGDFIRITRDTPTHNISTQFLCDSRIDAVTCGMISNAPSADIYHFSVSQTTGCTAWNVSIETLLTTTSDPFTVCTLSNTTTANCSMVTAIDGPLHRNLRAVINSETLCTDLDVVVEYHVHKKF